MGAPSFFKFLQFWALMWLLFHNSSILAEEDDYKSEEEEVDDESSWDFGEEVKWPNSTLINRLKRRQVESGGRIINGVNAALVDHPWIVYLKMCQPGQGCEMCGGSILSQKTMLTAKHCVAKTCDGSIFYGDVTSQKGRQFKFSCAGPEVTKHPDGNTDLAIIKLSNGKKFLKEMTPISIPRSKAEQPSPGEIVYVVGWGRACDKDGAACSSQNRHPDHLQQVAIKVSTPENCSYKVTRFCAGGLDDQGLPKDACNGDSGGPLECIDPSNRVYLCGVVSKGPAPPDCGRSPGAYATIASTTIIQWLISEGMAQNTVRIATQAGTRSSSPYNINGAERAATTANGLTIALILAVQLTALSFVLN